MNLLEAMRSWFPPTPEKHCNLRYWQNSPHRIIRKSILRDCRRDIRLKDATGTAGRKVYWTQRSCEIGPIKSSFSCLSAANGDHWSASERLLQWKRKVCVRKTNRGKGFVIARYRKCTGVPQMLNRLKIKRLYTRLVSGYMFWWSDVQITTPHWSVLILYASRERLKTSPPQWALKLAWITEHRCLPSILISAIESTAVCCFPHWQPQISSKFKVKYTSSQLRNTSTPEPKIRYT